MKNFILISLFSFLLIACTNNTEKLPAGVEKIPVDIHHVTKDVSSFLEKIELVPLETNDSSIFYKCSKVIYNKEIGTYAVYTSDQIIYTFTDDGKFIDHSKRKRGQGPEDYIMVIDAKWNPYLKRIDLLNPYGTIYTYSPTFELLAKRNYAQDFPVSHLMALDSINYIFNYPDLWTDQEISFENIKTHQTKNVDYFGTISGNNMANDCFYETNGQFYFVPLGLNYYLYRIDTAQKEIVPIIYLDFGDEEVIEEGLPGRGTGDRSNTQERTREISTQLTERYQYLKKSTNILPLIKLINEKFIYLYVVKTERGYGGHYIHNRVTEKGFFLNEGKPFLMYPCFAIEDNVLLSICLPEYLPQFVNTEFMSKEEICKMKKLKEDDNHVIIKYYLKK